MPREADSSYMNPFPFGKAALSILALTLLAGLWLAAHPVPHKSATLTYWTFAKPHYLAYQKALPAFEAAHPGVTVDLELVSNTALASRLQAALLADLDVPDLCEVEISQAGTLFRGPQKDIGFTDLTDRLHRTGLYDQMVQARFSPYTSHGRIYGLPHDVHPIQLAYRRDLFEKLGIDVNKIKTWDDFIAVGRRVTVPGQRYMVQFSDSDAGLGLEVSLFQRGGGYFDPNGRCIMDNNVAVQAMRCYVPLVAGPHPIGKDIGGVDSQFLTQSVENGYLLCMVCPDWRTKMIEQDMPRLSGKMALMDLPTVTPGGPATSTWGGTMLGITKHCRNQGMAWELAKYFYTDPAQLADRYRNLGIIPPFKGAWNQPVFQEPHPYWSGQKIGARYVALAPQVPYQYSSPAVVTAKDKFSEALVACVQYYNAHGDDGFEPFVRARLHRSADEVRALLKRDPY
jgi:arabinosaccharide transport system substrate-binding protein